MTLEELKKLSGVGRGIYTNTPTLTTAGSNISMTGNEKAQLQKRNNIQPGTDEWFKLWFSRPLWFKEGPNR